MTEKRLKKIQKEMVEKNIDAVIIEDKINRYYFSNFYSTAGILTIFPKEAYLFTDFRYTQQAKEEAKNFNVIETNNYFEKLKHIFKEKKAIKIGFDAKTTSFYKYNQYIEKIENINLVDISEEILNIRKIKDSNELDNIIKAQEITDRAFLYLLETIKPGKTEKEISLELEYFMKCKGAQSLSFDTIVASGKRSSLPHGTATNKKIEIGDLLTIDFGCIFNGYCSDMTRTVGIGKVDDKQKKIYNIVLKAQINVIENIKASISCKEADAFARDIINNYGYAENFGHGLGHGVGLEVHECPSLSPKSNDVLKAGMIVTIEPGIYVQNFGGVRIEDMGIIKKDGIDIITKSTKDLIII